MTAQERTGPVAARRSVSTSPNSYRGAISRWIVHLPPAVFSSVMATGIIGYGLGLAGNRAVGTFFSWIAVGVLVVLLVVLAVRIARYRQALLTDILNPSAAFGFFTIVAAATVVSLDLGALGYTGISLVTATAGGVLWVGLCYVIPALLVLVERPEPGISHANGTWFLWVVATQAVAGTFAFHPTIFRLGNIAALAIWLLGCMLYLMIATLVTVRMLRYPNRPETLSPTYWIFMGATAITVMTGSQLLSLANEAVLEPWLHPMIAFTCFALLSVGVWFIPLLVVFGYWRHVVRRHPLRYETGLWAIVFPLGMLSSCCQFLGRETNFDVLEQFGRGFIWVAVAAWCGTVMLWLGKLIKRS